MNENNYEVKISPEAIRAMEGIALDKELQKHPLFRPLIETLHEFGINGWKAGMFIMRFNSHLEATKDEWSNYYGGGDEE